MARSLEEKALAATQPRMPRRHFLKIGLAGTAIVTAGGVGLALRKSALRDVPAAGLKVFTAREYSIMAAIAAAICPPLGEGAPGADALDVASKADDMLANMFDETAQKEFKILLALFDNAFFGFLTEGRITPFTKLTLAEQQRSIENWGKSRLAFRRSAHLGLRGMATALYYGDEATWQRTSYMGPPDITGLKEARAVQAAAAAASTPKEAKQ